MKFEIHIDDIDAQDFFKKEIIDNLTKTAVEKQIPQNVKVIEDGMLISGFAVRLANCPSCSACVNASAGTFTEYHYCYNCGQRLKWRDEEYD